MTDELVDQYRTDDNLRRRQGLFDFAVPPPEPQPDLTSTFTWGPAATVLDVGCGNPFAGARWRIRGRTLAQLQSREDHGHVLTYVNFTGRAG